MPYLMLIFSIIFSVCKVICCKQISVFSDSVGNASKVNSVLYFISCIVMMLLSSNEISQIFVVSHFSILLSALLAASLVLSQLAEIKAFSLGPTTITSFIYSLGFLIPIVVGLYAWDETVSLFQICALMVIIASLFLIINPKKDKKMTVKWIVVSFTSMIFSGISAVIQKVHQYSDFAGEIKLFLVYTMFFASLYSVIIGFVANRKAQPKRFNKSIKKTMIFGGFAVAILNFVNLYLSGKLPSVIQFPTFHIGTLVLTGSFSYFILKEKQTITQLIGLALGVTGVILIVI